MQPNFFFQIVCLMLEIVDFFPYSFRQLPIIVENGREEILEFSCCLLGDIDMLLEWHHRR